MRIGWERKIESPDFFFGCCHPSIHSMCALAFIYLLDICYVFICVVRDVHDFMQINWMCMLEYCLPSWHSSIAAQPRDVLVVTFVAGVVAFAYIFHNDNCHAYMCLKLLWGIKCYHELSNRQFAFRRQLIEMSKQVLFCSATNYLH